MVGQDEAKAQQNPQPQGPPYGPLGGAVGAPVGFAMCFRIALAGHVVEISTDFPKSALDSGVRFGEFLD